jgi:hypothetical protein
VLARPCGETIEQNRGGFSVASESLGYDRRQVAIRYEPAGFERGADSRPEQRPAFDLLEQRVTDRDVRHGVLVHESAALGALSGAGQPREHNERRTREHTPVVDKAQRSRFVGSRTAHRSARRPGRGRTDQHTTSSANPSDIAYLVGSRKGECLKSEPGSGDPA